jgi:GH15 family glucan-1,4-alpha-glucosidase
VRGGRHDFTYSRLMCWVAIERAIRIASYRGLPADLDTWRAARDAVYHQIMSKGWNEKRKAFVQHFDSDVLDASLLLMPLVKFIAPTDPRWLSTLDAITKELVSDSLVYRYNARASPDGLEGEEGTFSICSFWYVEALARAAGSRRRGSPSRRCSRTRTISGSSRRRSGPRESSSAISPRPSPTLRSSARR